MANLAGMGKIKSCGTYILREDPTMNKEVDI